MKSKARESQSSKGMKYSYLHDFYNKARREEQHLRDKLKKADDAIADLRDKLESERDYTDRIKNERDELREKYNTLKNEADTLEADLEKRSKAVQTWRIWHESFKKELAQHKEEIADLKRKKNVEQKSRDAEVKVKTTAHIQRGIEKATRRCLEEYGKLFHGSGLEFDPEADSSDEETPHENLGENAAPGTPPPVEPPADEGKSDTEKTEKM